MLTGHGIAVSTLRILLEGECLVLVVSCLYETGSFRRRNDFATSFIKTLRLSPFKDSPHRHELAAVMTVESLR